MKAIVIYKSSSGHTQQYAHMLAEAIQAEVTPLNRMSSYKLETYDTIIFGGCVHASKIIGIRAFNKKVPKDGKRKILLFAVGANPLSDHNTQELIEKNLKELNMDFPLFYMQGGFDPDKLNFALRAMLQAVGKSIKKKEEKDPEALTEADRGFLEFFREKNSHVSKENLQSLIQEIV